MRKWEKKEGERLRRWEVTGSGKSECGSGKRKKVSGCEGGKVRSCEAKKVRSDRVRNQKPEISEQNKVSVVPPQADQSSFVIPEVSYERSLWPKKRPV